MLGQNLCTESIFERPENLWTKSITFLSDYKGLLFTRKTSKLALFGQPFYLELNFGLKDESLLFLSYTHSTGVT